MPSTLQSQGVPFGKKACMYTPLPTLSTLLGVLYTSSPRLQNKGHQETIEKKGLQLTLPKLLHPVLFLLPFLCAPPPGMHA